MSRDKIKTREEIVRIVEPLKAQGRLIVFTNGCFDLLHAGHVRYLEEARALGDLLVVGVNSDDSVRRMKGPERPFVPEEDRVEILAGLAAVDFVTVFDEDTPEETIAALRPHIHVKGGNYSPDELPEARVVKSYGGIVKTLSLLPGRSTSALIERIRRGSRQ